MYTKTQFSLHLPPPPNYDPHKKFNYFMGSIVSGHLDIVSSLMKKAEFYEKHFSSPLPHAIWKKWPSGQITQYWGENPTLYSNAFGQHDDVSKHLGGHSGIDIATVHRDKVYAAHDGTVRIQSSNRKSMGGLVLLIDSDILDDHGKKVQVTTAYAHLDQFAVSAGDRLKRGDLIGYEGNTGFVVSGGTPYWGDAPAGKGTHLHFMITEFVLRGGAWTRLHLNAMGGSVDPLPYLTGNWAGSLGVLENAQRLLKKWLKGLQKNG